MNGCIWDKKRGNNFFNLTVLQGKGNVDSNKATDSEVVRKWGSSSLGFSKQLVIKEPGDQRAQAPGYRLCGISPRIRSNCVTWGKVFNTLMSHFPHDNHPAVILLGSCKEFMTACAHMQRTARSIGSPAGWATLSVWVRVVGSEGSTEERQFEGSAAESKKERAGQTYKRWEAVAKTRCKLEIVCNMSWGQFPNPLPHLQPRCWQGEGRESWMDPTTAVMLGQWGDRIENPDGRLKWRATEPSEMS